MTVTNGPGALAGATGAADAVSGGYPYPASAGAVDQGRWPTIHRRALLFSGRAECPVEWAAVRALVDANRPPLGWRADAWRRHVETVEAALRCGWWRVAEALRMAPDDLPGIARGLAAAGVRPFPLATVPHALESVTCIVDALDDDPLRPILAGAEALAQAGWPGGAA